MKFLVLVKNFGRRNSKIVICLRGVIGMPSYRHIIPSVRWAPDLMMILALKKFTNIPIIYDPSHSTGLSEFVEPISKAALILGADGLIIEEHPDPKTLLVILIRQSIMKPYQKFFRINKRY